MTRRERLERKLERRHEWANKAQARSHAAFGAAAHLADQIPLGQPILVGHHSEKHARRDAERINSSMSKGCAENDKARHHEGKAVGLEHLLERAVFSDDADAVVRLEARAAAIESEADRQVRVNKAWRKTSGDTSARLAAMVREGVLAEEEGLAIARYFAICPYQDRPYPAYSTNNLRARARKDRERVEGIKRSQALQAQAEAAESGVVLQLAGDWVTVTFGEKPEREVLDALKAASFRWAGGSWCGHAEALPQCVRALMAETVEAQP